MRKTALFAILAFLFVPFSALTGEAAKVSEPVWRTIPDVEGTDFVIYDQDYWMNHVVNLHEKGETRQITSNEKLEFFSCDENIATVSEDGLITAVSEGFTMIFAMREENENSVVLPKNYYYMRTSELPIENVLIKVYVYKEDSFAKVKTSRLNIINCEDEKEVVFDVVDTPIPDRIDAVQMENIFDGRLYSANGLVKKISDGKFSVKLRKGMPTNVIIGSSKDENGKFDNYGIYKFVPFGTVERTYFAVPGQKPDGKVRQFIFEVKDGMKIQLPEIVHEPSEPWMSGVKTYHACLKTDFGGSGQVTFTAKFRLDNEKRTLEVLPNKKSKKGDIYIITPGDFSGAIIYLVVK